jgi:hypothetical protein
MKRTFPETFGVIIGAMKAGSTSLFDYLSHHQSICSSDIKETNYFSGDEFNATDLHEYCQLWSEWDPQVHKIAIEASVNYTKTPSRPNVAERISRFDANWKFIYLLRHPIERIESHLTHGQARNWNGQEISDHHLTCSMYARQLDAFHEHFGRDRIFTVISEELKNERESTMKNVLEFLGIEGQVAKEKLSVSSNTSAEHRTDHSLIKSLRKNPFLRKVGRCVPVSLRRSIRKKTGTPVSRVKLSEEQHDFALNRLKPDLIRLREVYGINCKSVWNLDL